MMTGTGPFGPIEMGGMFTTLKVRRDQKPGDYKDPGWYRSRRARRRSSSPARWPSRHAFNPSSHQH
jgi:hypothetical protein